MSLFRLQTEKPIQSLLIKQENSQMKDSFTIEMLPYGWGFVAILKKSKE